MKNLMIVMAQVLLAVGLMMGGLVWGQDDGSGGVNTTGDPGHWGNPEPYWCDEPCDTITTRYVEIEFTNTTSNPLYIQVFDFVGVTHPFVQCSLISGNFVPHPTGFATGFGQGWQCIRNAPFPFGQYPYHTQSMVNAPYCQAPFLIPPNSTKYGLARLLIIFNCNGDQIPSGQYSVQANIITGLSPISVDVYNEPIDFDAVLQCNRFYDENDETDPSDARINIDLEEKGSFLRVTPNPIETVGKADIYIEEDNMYSLELVSITGEKVKSYWEQKQLNVGLMTQKLDLTTFPPGIYFLKLKSSNTIQVSKIVNN